MIYLEVFSSGKRFHTDKGRGIAAYDFEITPISTAKYIIA